MKNRRASWAEIGRKACAESGGARRAERGGARARREQSYFFDTGGRGKRVREAAKPPLGGTFSAVSKQTSTIKYDDILVWQHFDISYKIYTYVSFRRKELKSKME